MKMLLCGLFFCALAYSATNEVEEGNLFTVEKEIAVPQAAYPAAKLYLETLVLSRPLPWPYTLEKYDVRDGKVVVQGRVLDPGKYEVTLGVIWWGGKAYALPSFSCDSAPVHVPPLTTANMLLPFPKEALLPTVQNMSAENELLKRNQEEGVHLLLLRDFWRHVFMVSCLFIVCAPCALQLWRWWQIKKKPKVIIPVVTPEMAFREVRELQSQGERPWPKLIYVLNLLSSAKMPSLTSYELEQRFAAANEEKLAKAAALIENYGYRPEADQYFDQTVALVEKRLAEKSMP